MNYNFTVFDEATRRFRVDRRNPLCPFHNVIGQDEAVELAADLCYAALGRQDHFVDANLMFVGNASTGKTHLTKCIAETLQIVTVITAADQVRRNDDLAHLILEAWAKACPVPLQPVEKYGDTVLYRPDPTLIFIDEIHGLTDGAQDGLLKATERADGMLFCKGMVFDLRKAFWIGATTDWHKLRAPFRTRFTRRDLFPYTAAQVAMIVQRNKKWDMGLCARIVHFGGTVPREVLAFAAQVESCAARSGKGMLEAVEDVARREGIDKWGMRIQRLRVLQALSGAEDGLLLRHLVGATGLQGGELLDYWLPPLLNAAPGDLPCVTYDSRYYLTTRGEDELRKRGM